jgi:hypothetical protein
MGVKSSFHEAGPAARSSVAAEENIGARRSSVARFRIDELSVLAFITHLFLFHWPRRGTHRETSSLAAVVMPFACLEFARCVGRIPLRTTSPVAKGTTDAKLLPDRCKCNKVVARQQKSKVRGFGAQYLLSPRPVLLQDRCLKSTKA